MTGERLELSPFRDGSDLPSARTLADLSLTLMDLRFVIECCRRIAPIDGPGTEDDLVGRALWGSAVVAYARCFNGGKRSGLDRGILDEVSLEGAREFHDTVMHLRNKHIAHSVNAFEVAKVGVIPSTDGTGVDGVAVLAMTLIGRDREEVSDFGRLAMALAEIVSLRAQEAQDRALQEARAMGAVAFVDRQPIRLSAADADIAGQSR